VTALLNRDTELAKRLIYETEDPRTMAWDAACLAASLIEGAAARQGREAVELWSTTLLKHAAKHEGDSA
jgi:hypothetical protein